MRHWTFGLDLDAAHEQPLFVRLADAVVREVRAGRLRAGDALPGTRALAAHLELNRNTVVAAYEELAAQGWVETRKGSGTFVAKAPAPPSKAVQPIVRTPTYALTPMSLAPSLIPAGAAGILQLANGAPDPRLFPARALARAFRRALERRGAALASDAACGHPRLRAALATMLAHARAVPARADTVMVTRSVEQGIDLVARALIAPGDVVAVEAWGYPPAWNALRLAGARLEPLPLDRDGIRIDALEALLARGAIRAVFITPHHQFPTAVLLSAERRARLSELALRHRFAIIEDDYDHEYHYAGKPVTPLAAGAAAANVVYVGSLANLLAPGICTGFVSAPAPLFARLAQLRAASDPHADAALECALAELFDDGEMLRHVRRTRLAYLARRDALVSALRQRLGNALDFEVAAGGLALWARADDGIDLAAWSREGAREGVCFRSAHAYDLQQRELPYLRLAFGYHDAGELERAVERMQRALARSRKTPAPRTRRDAGLDQAAAASAG